MNLACNCTLSAADQLALRQTRAAACGLCAGESNRCPYDSQLVSIHILGHPCPAGKHPGIDGLVRWMGMKWRGQPWPLRVWLWTTRYNDRDWPVFKGKFPGCGCIDLFKTWWERLVFTNQERDHADDAHADESRPDRR